jgi:hypothetical protein
MTLVACLAYSSHLKLEGAHSSETSVDLYQIIWHHNPEDSTLHTESLENLKSHFLCASYNIL